MRGGAEPRHLVGRVTIVQEDRIRVIDGDGRGYLLVVKHAASLEELERWRDQRARLHIWYEGTPDAGAVATEIIAVGTSI